MKSLHLREWNAFIRYHDIGAGDVVVYLPGLSLPATLSFLSVVSHPEMPPHRALLVDHLGSGASEHPDDFDYAMANHARTVAAILDHEGVDGAQIVGHSMGGTVGILLALARPDLVANLIVGEANITRGGGAATSHIASFSKDDYVDRIYARSREEWRQAAVDGDAGGAFHLSAWGAASPVGLHGNSVSLVNVDASLEDEFFGLAIPRTFVYGEQTVPTDPESSGPDTPDPERLRAHGIDTEVVADAGHGMMWDNLDGFVDVLVRTLQTDGAKR